MTSTFEQHVEIGLLPSKHFLSDSLKSFDTWAEATCKQLGTMIIHEGNEVGKFYLPPGAKWRKCMHISWIGNGTSAI